MVEHIILDIDPVNTLMEIEISEDNIREWETYPGKWQTWPIFN